MVSVRPVSSIVFLGDKFGLKSICSKRLVRRSIMVRRSIRAAVIVFLWSCSAAGLMVGQTVSPANTSTTIKHVGDTALRKWQNGLLLTFDDGRRFPARVYGYDRIGQEVINVPITIQDAARVIIYDTAASTTKTVAVSGDAGVSQIIAGVPAMRAFIAWISPQNQINRIIETYPYVAVSLAFATDDTLWAFGRQVDPGALHSGPHPMLRHNDQNGALLNEFLSSAALHYDIGTDRKST